MCLLVYSMFHKTSCGNMSSIYYTRNKTIALSHKNQVYLGSSKCVRTVSIDPETHIKFNELNNGQESVWPLSLIIYGIPYVASKCMTSWSKEVINPLSLELTIMKYSMGA